MAGIPHLVDPPTWDRAGWMAMAFLAPEGGPVGLGFVFNKDAAAAESIFSHWRQTLGDEDRDGILRVSLIHGDRQGPGYFVHASIDPERAVDAATRSSDVVDLDMRSLTGDVARWFPQTNPLPLTMFAERFVRERRCALVPVIYRGGNVEPNYSLGIVTSWLKLRLLGDITDPNDPDFPLTR